MSDSSSSGQDWKPWKMRVIEQDSYCPDSPLEAMSTPFNEENNLVIEQPSSTTFRHQNDIDLIKEKAFDDAYKAGYQHGLSLGQEKGYAEGFEQGSEAAKTQFSSAAEHRLQELSSIANQFSQSLTELDMTMGQQLSELAITVGEKLARHTLAVKPELIVDLVRFILREEFDPVSQPSLWLNPDDSILVKELLGEDLAQAGWRVQSEPAITRGGCKVTSKTGDIDARFESRLSSLLDNLHAE